MSPTRVLVAGGGGFIGGHLTKALLERGADVVAADIKPLDRWYQVHDLAESKVLDLSRREHAFDVIEGVDEVFNLAADMGGMGFIENNKAACMLSVLINTHLLEASVAHELKRYFFASSACVYAAGHQETPELTPLRESDAYPADPEDGYGWEKLFSERMCRHFREDFGLETRVGRYHNVYGPNGTFEGGREKAPAAISRKVAESVVYGVDEIEIWGDGEQTRSFMYIDDCVEGTLRLMYSDATEPINIGSDRMVSINELVSMTEAIAGVELERVHDLDAPQGVRGRNSDNTLIMERLGWAPSISLEDGMQATYRWILGQLRSRLDDESAESVLAATIPPSLGDPPEQSAESPDTRASPRLVRVQDVDELT